jgi:Cellulase M and related proteins
MDEVGLVARHIDRSGRIWFDVVGWVNPAVLPASPVDILTETGEVPGVVIVASAHLAAVAPATGDGARMWVDVGASDAADVRDLGISVGDFIVFDSPLRRLRGDRMTGKALDNRIGCAVLLELAGALDPNQSELDVIFGFSVQEELGGRGAGVLARRIDADLAVIVDTVSAIDGAVGPPIATTEIGGGPVIRAFEYAPRAGQATAMGAVYSAPLRASIRAAAGNNQIAIQADVATTFTDAASVQLSGQGLPVGGVFVPRNGSHSANEVASLRDVEATVELLHAWLRMLGPRDVARLRRPW